MGILLKSILATLLFIITMILSLCWFVISEELGLGYYGNYQILGYGILHLLFVILFLWFINRKTSKSFWKHTNLKWYFIATALGILFLFLQSPLNWFYDLLFDTEYLNNKYSFAFKRLTNINILTTILFGPIAEELFFRNYIQENLQEKLKPWIAIFVTAILFALIHAPIENLFGIEYYNDWHHSYITFFGGCISGIIYYKSKAIGPSILFHISWNIMATIL